MPRISRPVPITLDKARTLVLDFNAFVAIEDVTGDSALSGAFWRGANAKKVRAALWGALLHENDKSLTLTRVGDLISEHFTTSDEFNGLIDKLIEAWGNALPEAPKKEEAPV